MADLLGAYDYGRYIIHDFAREEDMFRIFNSIDCFRYTCLGNPPEISSNS